MRASWSSLKLASTHSPCAGHDRQQIGAGRDIGADLRGAVADIAVDRRADLGVAEVEPRGLQIGLAPARSAASAALVSAVDHRRAAAAPPASPAARGQHGGLRRLVGGERPLAHPAASRRRSAQASRSAPHRRARTPPAPCLASSSAAAWRMIDCCSTRLRPQAGERRRARLRPPPARGRAPPRSRADRCGPAVWPARTC